MDADAELMLKVKQGQTSCFNAIIDKYQKPIINFAYSLLRDRFEAEDTAQEVFLRVYAKAKAYRPKAKFSTYIFKVARNLCFNKLRRKKSHTLVPLEEGRLAAPDKTSPSRILEKKELHSLIEEALAKLPARQRSAVILSKYEGLPYKEIAKIMGCSIRAVKMLIHRAKEALREELSSLLE